jgi:hypothetical protein
MNTSALASDSVSSFCVKSVLRTNMCTEHSAFCNLAVKAWIIHMAKQRNKHAFATPTAIRQLTKQRFETPTRNMRSGGSPPPTPQTNKFNCNIYVIIVFEGELETVTFVLLFYALVLFFSVHSIYVFETHSFRWKPRVKRHTRA